MLFVVAALAFDVGMTLLERRDQQDAADAAALAGARYVLASANFSGSCAGASGNAAATAAYEELRRPPVPWAGSASSLPVRFVPRTVSGRGLHRTRPD